MISLRLFLGFKMKNKECCVNYLCSKEKVLAAKTFFKLINLFDSERAEDYAFSYSYIRKIDNVVDSGRNPKLASRIISTQRSRIENLLEGRDAANPQLEYIRGKYGDSLLSTFLEFLSGFEIDNGIIMDGKPPAEDVLKKRNLLLLLPSFKAFSIMAFGRELKYSENFKELIHTWARYDSLIDVEEDFKAGLILFSREELEKSGIRLGKGEAVPDSFENFFYLNKRRTIKGLEEGISYVAETNFPLIPKFAIRGYFKSRAEKLSKKDYSLEKRMVIGREN